MKRLKPASVSTVTTIRGGNVLRAKTNLPLVNQSLSYDGPHVSFNLNLMIVNLFEQRHQLLALRSAGAHFHLITLSALASTLGGIVRPSRRAATVSR